MSDSKVGVFPKNFLDQSPVPAPGSTPATSVPANPGVLSNRTKTVVLRDTKPEDKTTRRNIVSEMPISTNVSIISQKIVSHRPGPVLFQKIFLTFAVVNYVKLLSVLTLVLSQIRICQSLTTSVSVDRRKITRPGNCSPYNIDKLTFLEISSSCIICMRKKVFS